MKICRFSRKALHCPTQSFALPPAKHCNNKRNSTFHGHLTSENMPLREQQSELLAMSLRLHKLCSILLLKEAGFTGKVLNNEVLFGIKDACERKEHIYLDI